MALPADLGRRMFLAVSNRAPTQGVLCDGLIDGLCEGLVEELVEGLRGWGWGRVEVALALEGRCLAGGVSSRCGWWDGWWGGGYCSCGWYC